MQVSNTNVWTLERFMAVVGAGKIRGPIKRENDKWSDFYSWECQSWRGCKQVAELLWDNLSPRRKEQIELNVNRYFDGGGRNF